VKAEIVTLKAGTTTLKTAQQILESWNSHFVESWGFQCVFPTFNKGTVPTFKVTIPACFKVTIPTCFSKWLFQLSKFWLSKHSKLCTTDTLKAGTVTLKNWKNFQQSWNSQFVRLSK
jgi:hypothetical protein